MEENINIETRKATWGKEQITINKNINLISHLKNKDNS